MGPIQIELIRSAADIPLQADQWNALVGQGVTSTVFQTHEWFDSWWSTFGQRHQLHYLLLRRDAEIIGFAPLMMVELPRGRRELQFVGGSHADYADVVVRRELHAPAVAALMDFLARHRGQWDTFLLRNLPEQSPTFAVMRAAARQHGLALLRQGVVQCPALEISGREQEVQQLLAKYSFKRPTKWFARQGTLRFRLLTDDGELQRYLPVFFSQHVDRWRGTAAPSRLGDSAEQSFFMRLAQVMRAAGWLSFAVVELDNELLAAHYGFRFAGKLVWYKPSFNPRFRSHSPGIVLIRCLIQHALETGLSEMDFTIGDEDFKARFATVRRRNCDFRLFVSRRDYTAALLTLLVERSVGLLATAVQRLVRPFTMRHARSG